jgi:5'-3' exonuclease
MQRRLQIYDRSHRWLSDVLCYRVGYTTENDEEWIARARLRDMIGGILKAVNADDAKIFLSDSKENWRLQYFPNYKANRTAPKPKHLPYLQNLIVDEWEAEVAWGQEADDALGIEQVRHSLDGTWFEGHHNTVICSIDKDLLQIPGRHYNFVKEEFYDISPDQGLFRFYEQILVGDAVDNIRVAEGLSCPRIGPKKAYQLLEGCQNEEQLFNTVREAFHKGWKDDSPEVADQKLLTTGRVIKIRTKEDEIWEFPLNSQAEQKQ